MIEFAQNQLWKLFRFVGMAILIAYALVWLIGSATEMVIGNDPLSPAWILMVFR